MPMIVVGFSAVLTAPTSPGCWEVDVLADQPRKTGLLSQFQQRNQTPGPTQVSPSNRADSVLNVC